ncbi:MAG: polysaccharide biosynthesis/export family protein [Calditrichia bacterium]
MGNSTIFYKCFLIFTLWCFPVLSQNIGPGDGVRLTLYNISDPLTGDYYVQEDWHIQLPYIGLVDVRQREINEIRNEIFEKYAKIYRNPELTVRALYRINVLGEIKNPGVYFVTGVEKISDLLAEAGGETRDASINKIFFIREDQKMDIDGKAILEQGKRLNDIGLRSGDQIYIPRKRWLSFRNASVLISALALSIAIYDRSGN